MPILSLSVTGVRNLHPVTLQLSPHINIFYGRNGSGKTSLLESVYFLAMARSFRSSKQQPMIQQGADEALVFAQIQQAQQHEPSRLGVSRNRNTELTIRLNGETLRSVSSLAKTLPLQLLNAESFLLLDGAPKYRRQFLDWGVFHVEHAYMQSWQRLQQSLKQRNYLLRHAIIDEQQLAAWDAEFCAASEQIDQFRQAYLSRLKPVFEHTLAQLIHLPELGIGYYRGWDRERSLAEVLQSGRERDRQLGYTQAGPQRADIRIKLAASNAVDVLSRGQQKLVVCALKLAQGFVLAEHVQRGCIYLIDDLPAELDAVHRQALGRLLEQLGCQVLITGTDKQLLDQGWNKDTQLKVFHVEHGQINLVEQANE